MSERWTGREISSSSDDQGEFWAMYSKAHPLGKGRPMHFVFEVPPIGTKLRYRVGAQPNRRSHGAQDVIS